MQVSVGAEPVCSNPLDTARPCRTVQMNAALRLLTLEAQGARSILPEIAALRREHPVWLFRFEDVEPGTADAEEVLDLLMSAPNSFAKGLVFGMFTCRMQIAAVTGRAF